MLSACVIGISGYSGSGKTTLIEKVLPELKKDGLYVGVLKRAVHHGLSLDVEGKDTDRFYRAGADFVMAHDSYQVFARYPYDETDLYDLLGRFPAGLDLIITEGYKNSGISRVWFEAGRGGASPGKPYHLVLYQDDPGHVGKLLEYIYAELDNSLSKRPLKAGLLVGGRSARMGAPKALLKMRDVPMAQKSFEILAEVAPRTFLLGSADLPESLAFAERLPDVPGVEGPMAGMLGAFRWGPDSSWIISAVDMPLMDKRAWDWLLSQRRRGAWAVLPRFEEGSGVETTGACYEPMIFDHIESLAGKGEFKLQILAKHPKVVTPVIPRSLARAWKNVNTPAEWKEALDSAL